MNLVSVNVRDKDPVSASSVVWMIYNEYVPRIDNHTYQNGKLEHRQLGPRVISTKLPDTGRAWDYLDIMPITTTA